MSGIDSINSSLYFNAPSVVSKNNLKEEDSKTQKSKKTKSFNQILNSESRNLELDNSIPEIKGMTIEQATEFLIDSLYSEGEALKNKPYEENFRRYKKAISNFLKFVENQCFEVETEVGIPVKKGKGLLRTSKSKVYALVKNVNEKLERLAADILFNQTEQIKIAAKVNEISGLLVDILT